MKILTLSQRAEAFNTIYSHLPDQQLVVLHSIDGRPRLIAFWFTGGGNISSFYGAYQTEYLQRIDAIFPDCRGKTETVHLFSGAIPVSPEYTVVGLPDGDNRPELECNAEELSSRLPFRPSLILADPPYEEASAGKYAICEVNRPRVVSECARVLRPGGFLVWQDQALPVFSNNEIRLVGAIGYVRSTGNRFRMVTIFQKPTK